MLLSKYRVLRALCATREYYVFFFLDLLCSSLAIITRTKCCRIRWFCSVFNTLIGHEKFDEQASAIILLQSESRQKYLSRVVAHETITEQRISTVLNIKIIVNHPLWLNNTTLCKTSQKKNSPNKNAKKKMYKRTNWNNRLAIFLIGVSHRSKFYNFKPLKLHRYWKHALRLNNS